MARRGFLPSVMWAATVLLLALAATGCATRRSHRPTVPALVRVMAIGTYSEEVGVGPAGVIISEHGHVLTTAHAVLGESESFLVFREEHLGDSEVRLTPICKYRVLRGWEDLDLSLLEPMEELAIQPFTEIRDSPVDPEETLYWYGSGYTIGFDESNLPVFCRKNRAGKAPAIRIMERLPSSSVFLRAQGMNGFSGSPLLDNKGRIVAIFCGSIGTVSEEGSHRHRIVDGMWWPDGETRRLCIQEDELIEGTRVISIWPQLRSIL